MARDALFFRTLRRRACLELFARLALAFARLKNSKKRSACAGVQLVHAPLIQSILSNKGLLSAVVKCIFFGAVFSFIDLFFLLFLFLLLQLQLLLFSWVRFGTVDISKCNLRVIP